jgi:hypothetical protein
MKLLNKILEFFKNLFEKTTDSTWLIYHTESKLVESFTNFDRFEKKCKSLISRKNADNYRLEYWHGSKLEEDCLLTDYFSL